MKFCLLFCLLFHSVNSWSQGGKFALAFKNFKSSALPKGRDVYVYLPPGYEKNRTQEYPVLYMHDGQNLYDPARAFMGQTWNAQETLNALILQRKIRPIIVVGIDNTPDRTSEYTPDADERHQGGKADLYLRMIVADLRPAIESRFRVSKNRAQTAILGSSLGGLVSLYAGIRYPQVFGLVGALSPSIWWNRLSIVEKYRRSSTLPLGVYLDSGTDGGERPQDVDLLRRDLELRMPRGSFYAHLQQGATHSERFWAQRLPIALQFLFGTR